MSKAWLSISLQVSDCDGLLFLAALICFLVNFSFFPVVISVEPAHSEFLEAGSSSFTPVSDMYGTKKDTQSHTQVLLVSANAISSACEAVIFSLFFRRLANVFFVVVPEVTGCVFSSEMADGLLSVFSGCPVAPVRQLPEKKLAALIATAKIAGNNFFCVFFSFLFIIDSKRFLTAALGCHSG